MLKQIIVPLQGTKLTPEELDLFSGPNQPFGFILFARNYENPEQLNALTTQLRTVTNRHNCPILIDQEGGRVQRLSHPHFQKFPHASDIGSLFDRDKEKGIRASWLMGRLIAADLKSVGITINCAPVCDLRQEGAHEIIGNRSFHTDPQIVSQLANAYAEGLMAGGILPIIKHLPGHGRALVDSHVSLPHVTADLKLLRETDFIPFMDLSHMPCAMTAHIVYEQVDPNHPVTHSQKAIIEIIRGELAFKGILFSDAIDMGALQGPFHERATRILEAGCDLPLYCNGPHEETVKMLDTLPEATSDFTKKWTAVQAQLAQKKDERDDLTPSYVKEFQLLINQ